MRGLLDVPGLEGVRPLVDVLDKVAIELLQGLNKLFLAEHREDCLDAFVKKEIDGGFPEFVDPVSVESWMNADDNVWFFDPAPPDVPDEKGKCT